MNDSADDTVQNLLAELRSGDRSALDRLLPIVYEELREIAGRQRRGWEADDSLNTTALVHETYLRLAGTSVMAWEDRPHFLCVAARAMRQDRRRLLAPRARHPRRGHLPRPRDNRPRVRTGETLPMLTP